MTINAGTGDNKIYNSESHISIVASSGDDTVDSYGGANVTISAGNGNNSINNSSTYTKITVGTGNDTIYNKASNVTINAGKGADFVSMHSSHSGNLIQYKSGNDSIIGFNATDTLSIGTSYYRYTYIDDIVLSVGNDSITLFGAASLPSMNIIGTMTGGSTIGPINRTNNAAHTLITGTNFFDTINNYGNNVSIAAGAGDDSITNYGLKTSISAGYGEDTVRNYRDTVTIDAGADNDLISNEGSIVTISGGKGNDTIYKTPYVELVDGEIATVTVNANVIKYASGDGNDKIFGFNATDTLSITGGKYSTTKSGDDLIITVGDGKISLIGAASLSSFNIKGTLGGGITDSSTTLTITDSSPASVTVDSAFKVVDASKRTKAIKITDGNSATSILGGKGKDTIYGYGGDDTILGNAGNDILYGSAGNDSILGGDGADTLSGGYGNDSLNGGNGADTLDGGAGNDKLYGGNGNDSIDGYDGNDLIFGDDGDDSISGGNDDDTILGGDGNDYIDGGKGNDTLIGGAGNDTLRGDDGNDIFVSYNGDTILDYTAGQDTIDLGVKVLSRASVNGSDVIINGGITVKNGKGKELAFVVNGTARTIIGGAYLLGDTLNKNETLTSAIEVIDASDRTKGIEINGNSRANTIYGGSGNDTLYGNGGNDRLVGNAGNDKLFGGDGNDTLIGGSGNDSLWGNDGADTFIYSSSDGKDLIYGFGDDDLLNITGTFSATCNRAKGEVYFKVGSTSKAITLKDFTATTFNVNSTDYKISGSKLVRS